MIIRGIGIKHFKHCEYDSICRTWQCLKYLWLKYEHGWHSFNEDIPDYYLDIGYGHMVIFSDIESREDILREFDEISSNAKGLIPILNPIEPCEINHTATLVYENRWPNKQHKDINLSLSDHVGMYNPSNLCHLNVICQLLFCNIVNNNALISFFT